MELTITKDTARLEHLEEIVDRTQRNFIECGQALLEIQRDQLYEKVRGVASFETYINDRFGMARRTAYQLIDASKAVDNVRQGAQNETIPTNERQARPLARLEPAQQREAWQQAVATAPDGKVTAAHVYKIVKGMTNQEPPPKPKFNQPIIKQEMVSPEFQTAFDQMYVELKNASAMKWKTTSHKAALEMMQNLSTIAEQLGR